ncbi:MAG: hypothetical protein R3F13_03620 [Prosthecobacter sp.]
MAELVSFGQENESPVNTEIQLHDCEISGVNRSDGSTEVVFSTVYIHESVGVPGYDAGRIWTQGAKIVIGDSMPLSIVIESPIWVYDGSLRIGATSHEGFIPASGHHDQDAELVIVLSTANGSADGGTLRVNGRGVKIELCGEPS